MQISWGSWRPPGVPGVSPRDCFGPKRAPRRAKRASRGPQDGPRGPRMAERSSQDAQDGRQTAQEASKTPQEGSERTTKRAPNAKIFRSLEVNQCFWPLRAFLEDLLEASWGVLEASWALWGRSWGPLGPSWAVGRPKRSKCQNPFKHLRKIDDSGSSGLPGEALGGL